MKYYIDISDARNIFVKNWLVEKEEIVLDFNEQSLEKMIEGDILVFAPSKKFNIDDIKTLPKKIKLISGNLTDECKEIVKQKEIDYFNLMEDEIFSVKNANLTAEGVLARILEHSPKSIYENNVLILGGGRIAIALSVLLSKLGVKFSIVSYNNVKFPRYYLYTQKCFYKKTFIDEIKDYDVIVNTIPTILFEEKDLNKIAKDTIFLETASVNCLSEEKLNHFQYIKCPALPTKYCIQTAGRYMYEAIKGENKYD